MTEPESGAVSPARTGPPQLSVAGRLGPDRVAELCTRLRFAADAHPHEPLHLGTERIDDPDIGTVEALARVALEARRLGRRLDLDGAPPDLRELIAFAGFADVLRCAPPPADGPLSGESRRA
ncbi:MAG TPA: STAS domain-containing protein [Candidatus Limnocylindrales bacterium]|nr:STAS domain-containing protein [Candidatus Limnocylindrales bacterium]